MYYSVGRPLPLVGDAAVLSVLAVLAVGAVVVAGVDAGAVVGAWRNMTGRPAGGSRAARTRTKRRRRVKMSVGENAK